MINANQTQPGNRQNASKQGTQPRKYHRHGRSSRTRTKAPQPMIQIIASL